MQILRRLARSAAVSGCVLAFLLGVSLVPAGGDSGSSGLGRILQKRFSPEEDAQIGRAFRAALQAGIREREALDLVDSCVDGRFSAAQLQRVLSLATQLALGHLPTGTFRAKIEEGVAKRVPPDRVLQVAERRALMLNQAKAVLNSLVLDGFVIDDRDELLPDIAETMEAGRSSDEVRRALADVLQGGGGAGEIRRKLFP